MMEYQQEIADWLDRPHPQHTLRWAKTHLFLQQHRIDDVWVHLPSLTVLVQDEWKYYEMGIDWALKHYFARHTSVYNRLQAIRAMTDAD